MRIFVPNVSAHLTIEDTLNNHQGQIDPLLNIIHLTLLIPKYPQQDLVNKTATMVLRMKAKNGLSSMDFLSPKPSYELWSL